MDEILKRIEAIKKEIRETPYHKGTEHHIGLLRARLARLRDQIVEKQTKKGGGGGGGLPAGRQGFAIKKHGDATVVLVGFPSVGKSTLLNRLTNARSPVAPYSFTTITVIPGMMKYKGASIQILDVPGLIEGAATGRGHGKEVLSVARGADLLLLMTEVGQEDKLAIAANELSQAGVRISEEPPNIQVEKKSRGGVVIREPVKQDLSPEVIKSVAREFGIRNAEIILKEKTTVDRLIDAFSQNRVYVDALYVVNKADLVPRSRYHVLKHGNRHPLFISASHGDGVEELKKAIWRKFDLVLVYVAKPGQKPDYQSPIIVRRGSMLLGVAQKIGEAFAENVSGAKIWGPGAKFPSQRVSLSHKVENEMEVVFF